MGIVLVAIKEQQLNQKVKSYLSTLGLGQIYEAKDTDNLIRLARKILPEYIIFDPGSFGPNGLKASRILAREKIAPIIFIVSEVFYRSSVEDIINSDAYALTYLTVPFNAEQLRIAITTTIASYKKIIELEKKVIKLNEKITEQKKIKEAKELLMKKKGLTEPEAHRYLQKQSMDSGEPIRKIAQKIIDELF
ncbi:MAG: ANTAR domain-containing protein [Clostridia bacterium]|nr:ANTAR domain-containing protein [Clostridia bacterium]